MHGNLHHIYVLQSINESIIVSIKSRSDINLHLLCVETEHVLISIYLGEVTNQDIFVVNLRDRECLQTDLTFPPPNKIIRSINIAYVVRFLGALKLEARAYRP